MLPHRPTQTAETNTDHRDQDRQHRPTQTHTDPYRSTQTNTDHRDQHRPHRPAQAYTDHRDQHRPTPRQRQPPSLALSNCHSSALISLRRGLAHLIFRISLAAVQPCGNSALLITMPSCSEGWHTLLTRFALTMPGRRRSQSLSFMNCNHAIRRL